MIRTNQKWILWFCGLGFFILLAPWSRYIDLYLSHQFFQESRFSQNEFWRFIYTYGVYPAWIAAGIALVGCFRKEYRKPSLAYLLAFALGPGLLVSGLKVLWGRPRPAQTFDFGGFAPYQPFWEPVTTSLVEAVRSFPCGHCSVGFVFLILYFIGKREGNRVLQYGGLLFALLLGMLLSAARLAQGGHYFSDIFASFLVVWLVCCAVDSWIYCRKSNTTSRHNQE